MTLGELTLIYLACGAATLPLSILVLRFAVSLSSPNGESREVDTVFDRAIDVSVFLWIIGGLAFYFCAAHIERERPCGEQRTNQLTNECRRQLGAGVRVPDSPVRVAALSSSIPRRGPAGRTL